MGHLCQALSAAYDTLGFDHAAGGDEVFRHLVLARIIEPTSKLDSLRVLQEAGIAAVSYRTLTRRLPVYSREGFREGLAAACARQAALGPATLVLYDVTTLYFETDAGDGFRESGFSKERRLEPQITCGLLTDASYEIEKSFRMAKSDLAARPIYHRTRDSIEAHLTIVFAALAVSRWIENTTGWSIRKFVKNLRRYRTIQIQAGDHTITAADPLPADVHHTLEAIKTRASAH
jgi:hypothetical protein